MHVRLRMYIYCYSNFGAIYAKGLLHSVVCLLGVYLCSFSNNKNCLEAKGNELIQDKNTKPCFK